MIHPNQIKEGDCLLIMSPNIMGRCGHVQGSGYWQGEFFPLVQFGKNENTISGVSLINLKKRFPDCT